jgi:hypothetical protein
MRYDARAYGAVCWVFWVFFWFCGRGVEQGGVVMECIVFIAEKNITFF